jgi:hypothetical protein
MSAHFFHFAPGKIFKIFVGGAIIVALFMTLLYRSQRFGNQITSAYAFGLISGSEAIDRIVPKYLNIAELIQNNPPTESSPNYVYRIGTFINYFLKDNDRRVLNDAQLDTFTCIDKEKDNATTYARLKKLGFKYFILDLNTATIEKDSNGTLHQKTNRFRDFASKNLKMVYNLPERGIAFLELQ